LKGPCGRLRLLVELEHPVVIDERDCARPEIRRYAYIDALRGYAILLVIAVHASQYFSDLSPGVFALANQGARGVQLFFVASAMTLLMSWNARGDGAKAFYIRRFFRIAPMFYISLPIFLILQGFGPTIYAPDGIGLRHVLMAATFTHGFMPDTITSVVPGSWLIADEMIFYAVFPLLMAIRVSFARAVFLTLAATIVCVVIEYRANAGLARIDDPAWRAVWADFFSLWIVNQFPCFLFGLLAARWLEEGGTVRFPAVLVIGASVTAVVVALYPLQIRIVRDISLPVQYGALFAIFALGLSHWRPKALVNPVICWIGKVSYSGYLVHLAIINGLLPVPRENYLETFVCLSAMTIAISSLTFIFIEQPMNRIGHRLSLWTAPKPAERLAAG
jgi:exopolysaccharide production protein ExoZ